MARSRYMLFTALTVLLLGCRAVSAAAVDGPYERESFDFKAGGTVFEDWYGIFLEGAHVGWRHVLVSKVKRDGTKVYLYEETEHLEFGRETRDVEIKALYDLQYLPIALLKTTRTGEGKDEKYVGAIYGTAGGGKELKSLFVQSKGFVGNIQADVKGPVMFDCALEQYFRYRRRSKPETEEKRWIFDTSTFMLKPVTLVAGKPRKRKIDGVEIEVREAEFNGKTRYFNRSFEPLLVVDPFRGLRFIRGSENVAKAKEKVDADYVPDPNLGDNTYLDRGAGFSIKRPSAAWSVFVAREGPITKLGLQGLITEGKVAGLVCTGIPAETDMKTASKKLKRLVRREMLLMLGWRVEIGKDREVDHKREGHKRVDSDVEVKFGMVTLKGKCSVIVNGNVAMLALCVSRLENRDVNEKAFERIRESIRLTPVKDAAPPTYEDEKRGWKITLPSTLWMIEEKEEGVLLYNPWQMARGAIMVNPVQEGARVADVAAEFLKILSKDWGFHSARERRGLLDGRSAKSYIVQGPLPLSGGIDSRARVYVALKDGFSYFVMLALPADQYKRDKTPIEEVLKGFKFAKKR